MEDGALYCEHCGEDIHIVPDFEPELEQNIQQIISGIMEDLEEPGESYGEPEGEGEDPDAEPGGKTEVKHSGRKKLLIFLIPAAVLFVAGLGAGIWIYLSHSLDYQIKKAVKYAEAGNYDKAITYYQKAIELEENDIELRFSLAEMYLGKNNKVEYEYLLREIARDPGATTEQLDRAYGSLIAIYRDRGDYATINELILGSGNDRVISMYQNYIANPPEFSVMEGEYTAIQPLKLTAMGNGKIFYTMDGSDPDENSPQYTMPIILEKGRYVVKAIFINENGIESDIVKKEYYIENDDIPAPEINVVSGEYYVPTYIEVVDPREGEEIFYTTDGSVPDYTSQRYTGPIPMPVGASRYMFAIIEDGVVGDVAQRSFVLKLNTEITPEQAVESVWNYVRESGRIYDDAGHFDDTGAIYVYEYLYVANINRESDYYVIAEVKRETDSSQVRTGNFYAVDIYDGGIYRYSEDEHNQIILTAIEEVN